MMSGKNGFASERLNQILSRIASGQAQGSQAYLRLFSDTAPAEAHEADRRARSGESMGLLDGVLVSVKSMLDVRGVVTDAGSATLRGQPPSLQDCTVVSRLRSAGAILVGATQMTEFAFSAVGTNPNFPVLGNPHDRSRVSGGSSSGAAVSVGEGLADIAIGTDTGGSLRIPAALCGLVGFKPTASRVPTNGVFPLSETLDTIGPIAASVRSCALADTVISASRKSVVAPLGLDRFRLIVAHGRLFEDCDAEVSNAFTIAIDKLRRSGVGIVDGSLESILDDLSQIDAIGTFPPVELAATLRAKHVDDLSSVDPNTRVRIEAGFGLSAVDYLRMKSLREQSIDRFEDAIGEDEIYIVPTVPIVAPPIAAVNDADEFHRVNTLLLRNPRVANLLDCPSISVPLPSQGLPVGVMLIGRRHSDQRLLSVALRLENMLANAELASAGG